ncbi:putative protein serine/threonine kinase [Heterostelium album PN500]|uniref:non-specific serine/threonine protein kinase n=1 Tax=Heterostelium pallidum (strain ATCC 26659 / Pp 5 / PN500) TaxID=670386 RepID=D3BVJ7_HETP5|nr:putative protein serine/threonine kinase [Heterostelium album PN500]EFA74620.1 putative protein serine/threonine kinase [Heterostelium album PN500]|eukprot:XP_020426754.1 putative protein serine/threonine kinase [Heterostelium album PN500]
MVAGYICQYSKIGMGFKVEMTACEGMKRFNTIIIVLNKQKQQQTPIEIEVVSAGEVVNNNNNNDHYNPTLVEIDSTEDNDTTPLISHTPKGLWRYKIMDKLFEIGNSMFEAPSEKINTLNLSKKKRYISERAGNMLGVSGNIYEIHGRRYSERSKIAEGGFGLVYLVRDDYNRQYALKRMFIQEKDRLDTVVGEIGIMQQLKNHKNIVKLEDYKIVENREKRETEVLMLLEFCSGGSVLDIMNHRGEQSRLSEREILAIFSDTCNAVAELHSQQPPFAHRDLKIENILYCETSCCYKLCDFGSATIKTYDTGADSDRNRAEDDINTYTTLFYRAPEMVDLYRRQVISEKVDIWALGCLLFKMAFYVDPFDGALAIMNARYQIPTGSRYSQAFHSLIEFCLVSDPEQRPSIFDVMQRLDEIRGGGSGGGRRQGLQTFASPQKQQQSRPLSNSDPSSRATTTSNNSTPSVSSPASTSSRSSPASTPTTARKQNLFDVLDWSDSNGNQSGNSNSTNSSRNGTPQQFQTSPTSSTNSSHNKPQQSSLIDDFDWSVSSSSTPPIQQQQQQQQQRNNNNNNFTSNNNNTFGQSNGLNNNNQHNSNNTTFSGFVSSSTSSTNSEFDFDPFGPATTPLKPTAASNSTKPKQQDEISFETVNTNFSNVSLNNSGNNNYNRPQQNGQQQSSNNTFTWSSSPSPSPTINNNNNNNKPNGMFQSTSTPSTPQQQQQQQNGSFNSFLKTTSSAPSTPSPISSNNNSINNNNNNSSSSNKSNFTAFDQPLKPISSTPGSTKPNLKNSAGSSTPLQPTTTPPVKPNYNIDLNSFTQSNSNNNFYGHASNLKAQGASANNNNKPANNTNVNQAFTFDSFAMYQKTKQ